MSGSLIKQMFCDLLPYEIWSNLTDVYIQEGVNRAEEITISFLTPDEWDDRITIKSSDAS